MISREPHPTQPWTAAAGEAAAERATEILESITDGFFAVDRDWRFTYVNRRAEEIFTPLRKTREILFGRVLWAEFPALLGTEIEKVYRRTMSEHVTTNFEAYYAPLSSWFSIRCFPAADGISVLFQDVTARKQAELDRHRFLSLAENSSEFVAMCDLEFRPYYVNPAGLHLVGLGSMEQARGIKVQEWFFPEDRRFLTEEFFPRVLRDGTATVEIRFRHFKTGEPIWIIHNVSRLTDPEGRCIGYATVSRDITDRKQTDEALRAAGERYLTLFNSIDEGFGIMEVLFDGEDRPIDYRFLEVNPAFVRQTGMVNPVGRRMREMVPDIEPHWIEIYGRVALTGESTRFENHAEPLRRWFDVFAFRVGPAKDRRVAVLFTDVTAHKQAQEALRDSEERFRAVMEQAPFSIQVLSREGFTTRVNRAWEALWGLTIEQMADYNMLNDPQLEARGVLPFIRRAFAGEAVEIPAIRYDPDETLPDRSRHADSERWVGAFAYPIKGPRGEVREVVLAHQDITARTRAEQALRESEERYRATFENAAMGMAHVALDGRLVLVNDALCSITGYTREELLAKTFADITHPDDREENWRESRRALAGEISTYSLEKRYVCKNGSVTWVRVTASLIRDPLGAPKMFIGLVEDVNEQRTASERLERIVRERTAALRETVQQLETFSYSIVHDMRAPLRSMRSFAGILEEEYSTQLDAQGRDYLGRIMSSASRLDALITDVLSYSRVSMNEAELSPVNLDALIPDVIEHYPQFEKAAGCIHVQRPLARVLGNSALLTQVVSNLVGNALKFMPAGRQPRIVIRTEESSLAVRLLVEDNGIGIAPEHQRRIFGLFERLHGPHEYAGTGVGLAIVSKAVERMGGRVIVQSQPNLGSTFIVELAKAS